MRPEDGLESAKDVLTNKEYFIKKLQELT